MALTSQLAPPPSGMLANLGPINLSQIQTAAPPASSRNTGITGGMAPGGGDTSLAGMSPEQQYWAAVQGLGWNTGAGNQYRGQQQQLVDYLAQHGAGQWQGGGMKADDWLQDPTGGQHDIITSGGQLVFNPDNPTAGTGGGAFGGGGSLIDDPGYQFQLGEGLKALQRSAAARGTLLTGGTLKGLNQYAQDYANTAYQNAFNRNLGVAQLGLGAAGSLGNLGAAYGRSAAGLYGDLGNAGAAGTIGQANQWGGLLAGAGNTWQDYFNQRKSGGGGVTI